MPKYILEISYDIDVQIKKTFNSFYLFNLTFKNIKENTQNHTFPAKVFYQVYSPTRTFKFPM